MATDGKKEPLEDLKECFGQVGPPRFAEGNCTGGCA